MRLFQSDTINATLSDSIVAMDRLNSFVRSLACWSDYWKSMHDIIYTAKGLVIQDAHDAGIAFHRQIYVHSKCRKCDGSGEFKRYGSYSGDFLGSSPCWTCSGRGPVTLDFIETRIELGNREIVWHSPLPNFNSRIRISVQGTVAALIDDWKPNTPGNDLTTEELAGYINAIEATYADRIAARVPEWQRRYVLKIGSTAANRCSLCGAVGMTIAYGVTRNLLGWSDHACEACQTKYREHWQSQKAKGPAWVGSIFDAFTLPKELMTPNVALWASKRKGMKEYFHCDPMERHY